MKKRNVDFENILKIYETEPMKKMDVMVQVFLTMMHQQGYAYLLHDFCM
ncbi:MAG TPA: hypothetical protein EYH42_04640 [Sulfurovum sp.]|nr:hypothetical protein [Sulfurovum sp.]